MIPDTAFGTALGTAFGTALGTAFTTAFTTAFNRSAVGMVIIGVTAVMMVFMESFASIGVTAVGQPKSLPIALVAPSP